VQPGELKIEDSVADARHTLTLAGELDLATFSQLEARIKQGCAEGAEEIVLDLDQLVFVDSTGLRALMNARSICGQNGCELVLTRAREPVERLFELTGLAQKLPLQTDALSDGTGGDGAK
jgi:anti-anti-sigma factor